MKNIGFFAKGMALAMALLSGLQVSASRLDHYIDSVFKSVSSIITYDSTDLTENNFININFRLSRYDFDPSYMGNDTVIEALNNLFDRIGWDNITAIEAVSQSSPEGQQLFNEILAENRAKSTAEFFMNHFPALADLVTVVPNGEAWNEVRAMVAADTLMTESGRQKVLDVIDSDISIDEKKEKMSKGLGTDKRVGDIYRYVYHYYYKKARYSGISVSYISAEKIERLLEKYDTVRIAVPEPVDTILPVDSMAVDTAVAVDTLVTPVVLVYPEPSEYREPMLSVKTNLLYDLFFYPGMGYEPILNIEAEYYPEFSDRWTILAEMEFPWWSDDSDYEYFQMHNWQLEGRRYFSDDNKHLGHYVSAYAQFNLFDFCMGNSTGSGVQGEGAGIGLGYGYVMPLGWGSQNRWKLEFFVKAGYYESHYDPYDAGIPFEGKYYYRWYEEPENFIRRNWRFRLFGPTGVGVTLSYDLLDRPDPYKPSKFKENVCSVWQSLFD